MRVKLLHFVTLWQRETRLRRTHLITSGRNEALSKAWKIKFSRHLCNAEVESQNYFNTKKQVFHFLYQRKPTSKIRKQKHLQRKARVNKVFFLLLLLLLLLVLLLLLSLFVIMEVFIEHNSPLTKYSCERVNRPRQLYCICTQKN